MESVRRLSIVAFICFFPLALIGLMQEKKAPEKAIKLYQASIFILAVFFCFLALYTYGKGGNFIKPMGTFY